MYAPILFERKTPYHKVMPFCTIKKIFKMVSYRRHGICFIVECVRFSMFVSYVVYLLPF